MPKARDKSFDKLRRKLRKIERELYTRSRTRSRSRSSSRPRSRSPSYWDTRSRQNSVFNYEEQDEASTSSGNKNMEVASAIAPAAMASTAQRFIKATTTNDAVETTVDLTEKEEEVNLSEDILTLLGEAPEEVACGPDLLPQLCSRWQDIIKKGLNKDEKNKIIKKYPPPGNCKVIDAPRLNPEAQAAAGDTVIKRDKAIEAKQKQVSCALTAIGLALQRLCKLPSGSEETITLLSDSARLLCDYQHCESLTRRQFILTGLDNKIAREAIKDTEVDQWLFGENMSEKLRASKAIERSSKDLKLKGPTNKPKKVYGNLNYKGPSNNAYKPRPQGQKSAYQQFPKKQFNLNNISAKPYQQKSHYQRHHNIQR